MNTQTKRLLVIVLAGIMIIVGLSTWGVIRVAGWVTDLPNRIEVDGDAIADALQTAVVQSYHHALQSGDAETQLNILQEFSKQAAADPAMRNWMQAEYGEDLQRLASSADVEVSGEASRLLDQLDR